MGEMKKEKNLLFFVLILAFILRVIKVNDLPPLYTDEASFGYNSYSILKTGRDEYGKFLPLVLRSFGDWKPALSSYLAIPFIALFGLNEFSVRLPSVILGTATVFLIYKLVKELFKEKEFINSPLALVSAFLLAISPWHIHFSRMTMLVGIECFFIVGGVYFFLKAMNDQEKFLPYSAAFYSLAFYTYYGARITIPLILLSLFFLYKRQLSKLKKNFFFFCLLSALMLLPLVIFFIKNPAVLSARVKWVSLFRYPEVRIKIWQATVLDGVNANPLVTRFLHNKPTFYTKDILRRILQHFSPNFLLFYGDKAAPFQISGMGTTYLILYPFLVWGFIIFIKKFRMERLILFFMLFISAIPASFTAYTPAANRSFGMVIPLQILTALGLISFLKIIKTHPHFGRIKVIFSILFFVNFIFFLRQYFYVNLKKIPREFHFGQKELVNFIKEQNNYEKVINSANASSYIYYLFYQKYSPSLYWSEAKINTNPNDFGFEHVESFNRFFFKRNFDWATEEKKEKILYIGYPSEFIDKLPLGFREIKDILYPDKKAGIKVIAF